MSLPRDAKEKMYAYWDSNQNPHSVGERLIHWAIGAYILTMDENCL